MALARLDLPSVMLYGGSIMPGQYEGHDVTIQDVFEAVGACAATSADEGRAESAARNRELQLGSVIGITRKVTPGSRMMMPRPGPFNSICTSLPSKARSTSPR